MRNYDSVLDQMRAVGLEVDTIDFGRIVRCRVEGRRGKHGWYALHTARDRNGDEIIVGAFGEWVGADKTVYKVELAKDIKLNAEEREAVKRRMAEDRKRAELLRNREAEKAAQRAAAAWPRYATSGDSEYLRAKGVGAYGVRFTATGAVVVPVYNAGGVIQGLQILRGKTQAAEAKKPGKQFWPTGMAKQGHFHLIGIPRDVLLVVEGYATGATVHEATGLPVAIAFDCGNLLAVCQALRKRYRQARILICADDDSWTGDNPGATKARLAALECGGEWLLPGWPDAEAREAAAQKGRRWTDFNDLAASPTGSTVLVGQQIEEKLRALGWLQVRQRAADPHRTGGGGERQDITPIDDLDHLVNRYVLVYAANGMAYDRQEHQLLKLTDVRDACRRSDLYRSWMEHPDRAMVRLDEVGFDPTGRDASIRCNLWRGWPTVPQSGSCANLIDLLAHLCSAERNAAHTTAWVLKWLAYPLQHPGAKMKTALVMHGPQGTGKNLFFEAVMAIYGRHGRVVGQDQLEDKHNSWASRLLFLLADEVVARSDVYQVKNKLKHLITGDWIEINPKHLASYRERNHCNIVFLSNETLPVVIEKDDRRHAVVWTPGKLDPEFYHRVLAEIDNGGIAALHDYLLSLPLGDFHPGTPPPETDARQDLIEQSLDSTDRFFLDLVEGQLEPVTAMPCLSRDLYRLYQTWCTRKGHRAAPEPKLLAAVKKRHGVGGGRERYTLPDKPPSRNAHGFMLIGPRSPDGRLLVPDCPPDKTRGEWLGGCFAAFAAAVNDWRGESHAD